MERRDRSACRSSGPLVGRLVAVAIVAAAASVSAGDPAGGSAATGGGHWQVPGEIQQPKGTWQVPGEIQKAGEIRKVEEKCRTRLVLGADTLFEFDRADLTAAATKSLGALASAIRERHARGASIEGHTDAKGGDDYNQKLSEQRAAAVRDWLVADGAVAKGTPIVDHGETRPVAPNTRPDGSDDPEARARNRRVEVVLSTCEP